MKIRQATSPVQRPGSVLQYRSGHIEDSLRSIKT